MYLKSFFGEAQSLKSEQCADQQFGVRVENKEDPLMRKIRILDKRVDELAKGKAIEKVLRG